MNDHDALLANIIANPDDDTVRLIYADWLDENDQGERAEFIRLQVAKPECQTWYNGASQKANRADELLRRNGHEWLGNFYEVRDGHTHGRNWIWYRGFVNDVICTAADWLQHADAILARHPVRNVTLTTLPDQIGLFREVIQMVTDADGVERVAETWHESDRWKGIRFTLPPESPPEPMVVLSLDIETSEDPRRFLNLTHRVNSTPVMGWPVGSLILVNVRGDRSGAEPHPWIVHFEFAQTSEMQVFAAGIGEMVYDSVDFVEVIERSGRVRFPTE